MTPPVPAEGRTGGRFGEIHDGRDGRCDCALRLGSPTPPRRDDLGEIGEELVRKSSLRHFQAIYGYDPSSSDVEGYRENREAHQDAMRAALSAVLPDDRARVEREVLDGCASTLRAWASAIERGNLYDDPPSVLMTRELRALADRWSRPSSPEQGQQQ